MGQSLGVLDEVGGFVDEGFYGVDGFAEAGVGAIAVEDVSPCCIAVPQTGNFGVVQGKPEEGAGGVGGFGGQLASAGKDQGIGGALGGAPGFVGGVTDVAGSHALKGGFLHLAGIGEDGGGIS